MMKKSVQKSSLCKSKIGVEKNKSHENDRAKSQVAIHKQDILLEIKYIERTFTN